MDHLVGLAYILYGVATAVATASMVRKLNRISADVQEVKSVIAKVLDERRQAGSDLVGRLEQMQNMRFSYMGRQKSRGEGDK
jgi:hypothetical protein